MRALQEHIIPILFLIVCRVLSYRPIQLWGSIMISILRFAERFAMQTWVAIRVEPLWSTLTMCATLVVTIY